MTRTDDSVVNAAVQNVPHRLLGPLLTPLLAFGIALAACSSSPDVATDSTPVTTTSTSNSETSSPQTAPSGTTKSSAPTTETEPTTTAATAASPRADAPTSELLVQHPISVADEPCPPELPEGAQCGLATVPLDWTTPDNETIEIWYAVQPASVQPATGTLIPLEGGPGEALSASFADYAGFSAGMASSDTLFVDVRGVGRSSRLECPTLDSPDSPLALGGPLDLDAATECADEIGERRNYFNTVSSVLDIEAIRRALDLGDPSLVGFSYGTFVASIYTVLFPDDVQATVLDGAFPLVTNPWADDVPRAVGESAALQCERSGECDPVEIVDQIALVAAELARQPREFAGRAAPFGEGDLITLAQGTLQTASKEFRDAVAAAAEGDFAPLEALQAAANAPTVPPDTAPDTASDAPTPDAAGSIALGVTVICNDYVFPFDIATDLSARQAEFDDGLAALPEDAFAPFSKAGWIAATWDHPDECLRWPVPTTPTALLAPIDGPFPDVPVLVLNGDLDLQTPLEGAEDAADQWPVSEFLLAPNGTHVVTPQSECLLTAAVNFFQTKTFPALDVCADDPLPLPSI
jgi:pimeloyl-ACP methyl ester carboxylesterase